jgi:hypothetical protein
MKRACNVRIDGRQAQGWDLHKERERHEDVDWPCGPLVFRVSV